MMTHLRIVSILLAAGLLAAGCVADKQAAGSQGAGTGGAAPTAQDDEAAEASSQSGVPQSDATSPQEKGRGDKSGRTTLIVGVPVKLMPTKRIAADSDVSSEARSYGPRLGRNAFRCGGKRTLVVNVSRQSAEVVDPEGQSLVLEAAPPGQSSRFAKKGYSLVLDNGEALYTKPGRPPFDCRH